MVNYEKEEEPVACDECGKSVRWAWILRGKAQSENPEMCLRLCSDCVKFLKTELNRRLRGK